MLRAVVALPALADAPDWRYWYDRFNVDQTGDTCVANGWTHKLGDSPRTWTLSALDTAPLGGIGPSNGYVSPQSGQGGFRGRLYDMAQAIDEWADTPPAGGTSVRAGAKVLQSLGLIGDYRWTAVPGGAYSLADTVTAVLTVSPVVMGVTWYSDMFASPGGWLFPTGEVVGGHCVVIDGASRSKRKVRIQTWGVHYWMTFDALEVLLADYGEACVALEP